MAVMADILDDNPIMAYIALIYAAGKDIYF